MAATGVRRKYVQPTRSDETLSLAHERKTTRRENDKPQIYAFPLPLRLRNWETTDEKRVGPHPLPVVRVRKRGVGCLSLPLPPNQSYVRRYSTVPIISQFPFHGNGVPLSLRQWWWWKHVHFQPWHTLSRLLPFFSKFPFFSVFLKIMQIYQRYIKHQDV